jgi:hypothetical protein
MPNGKKGDHPLTDFLYYGESTLPEDIQQLIKDIVAADESAFNHVGSLNERSLDHNFIEASWFDWEKGEKLDEARAYFGALLELSRAIRDERDPVADAVSASVVAEYPTFEALRTDFYLTYPLDFPDSKLAGVRVNYDSFLIYSDMFRERLIVETYPMPSILWNGSVVYRFAPGDSKKLIAFLKALKTGEYVITDVARGPFTSDGASVYPADSVPKLGFARVVKHRVKFPE